MKYKAVLFDLDGTLVYTLPEYRYLTVGKTLRELGVSCSEHLMDMFWFRGDRDSIIQEHFGIKPDLFWKSFRKYDNPKLRAEMTKPFEDIDFLNELRSKDYKLGIVTGAPVNIAYPEIELIGKDNFDAIVIASGSNGITPKPHPHGVLECLSMLGIKNRRSIGVGNSDEDIEAFVSAGVYDVLVDRKEHEYPLIPARVIINSLYELREILKLTE